ncbi:MAG: hypothetical protein A2284_05815 [Deltaproteobacteria bacterium RIFOXYA12_FULL_61_11]|nr:MAG: hypothetical protein A2284_05815 [Deltaproteobacteria bacterium RIFOXYA12_FULL_61_11]
MSTRLRFQGVLILSVLLSVVLFFRAHSSVKEQRSVPVHPTADAIEPEDILAEVDPEQLLSLLEPPRDSALPALRVTSSGREYLLHSNLRPRLQLAALDLLARSGTLAAAAVILDPATGDVLALAEGGDPELIDQLDPLAGEAIDAMPEHLALASCFPAASLFKLVTAAGAVESRGLDQTTVLKHVGRKHTLYRFQLRELEERYGDQVDLATAFARSINPVFGKLGIFFLGPDLLTRYAHEFLFNRDLPFELPVGVSQYSMPEEEFALAEAASGFNKSTTLSPLHAALLAATVVNHGLMMKPRLLTGFSDPEEKLLVHTPPSVLAMPIDADTSLTLAALMEETVRSGTCRKTFRRRLRRFEQAGMTFGAKTGTVNDLTDRYKIDWTIAYSEAEDHAKTLAVAVLAIHGESLGIRSSELTALLLSIALDDQHRG